MPTTRFPRTIRSLGLAGALALSASPFAAAGDPPAPLPPANPTAPSPNPTGPVGAPPARPVAAPADPAAAERNAIGAGYFDEAIKYVARGGALGKAADVYAHIDVVWDLPGQEHKEGVEALWYVAPDKMRTELTGMQMTSTKILNGERAWAITTNGTVHRLHATPGAEADVAQLKEDLVRVRDLTDFVTLEGLKGPGVRFEFVGATKGWGAYAGDWLKIVRTGPDGRHITFWLAHEKDAAGVEHATWPGVVRVDGDPGTNLYTEDWILKDWDSPSAKRRPFRYPFHVEAYRFPADPVMAKTVPVQKFLSGFVDDIQLNAGIDATRFEPPQPPAGR